MNQVRLVPNGDEPVWQPGDLFELIGSSGRSYYCMLVELDAGTYAFVNLEIGKTIFSSEEVPPGKPLYAQMKGVLNVYQYTHLGSCMIEVSPEKK